jgi:TatD DNase family protein
VFVDAHVHVHRFDQPLAILAGARAAEVVCIAVTETPSDFELLHLRAGRRPDLRVALGAHPLQATRLTVAHLRAFTALLARTQYVGEVGLDGSRVGRSTLPAQRRVFEHVLSAPGIRERILSVHSRGAEAETIAALEQANVTAILHWYSGALKHADHALNAGVFFSINAAMLRSQKGVRLLKALPRDRVLTETDGPHLALGARRVTPSDIPQLVRDLAAVWSCDPEEARSQIWQNMAAVFETATGAQAVGSARDGAQLVL